MTEQPQPETSPERERGYEAVFQPDALQKIERTVPGGAGYVLGRIGADMQWQADRQDRLDRNDYTFRVIAMSVGAAVVLAIAACATVCILLDHNVAGSILGGVDLVALAAVFVNAAGKH